MRGKGSKLGEPCPKVWLSQYRLPKEPLTQQQFSGLLCFGILTFGIITFGKSSWRPKKKVFIGARPAGPRLDEVLPAFEGVLRPRSPSSRSKRPAPAWPCPCLPARLPWTGRRRFESGPGLWFGNELGLVENLFVTKK